MVPWAMPPRPPQPAPARAPARPSGPRAALGALLAGAGLLVGLLAWPRPLPAPPSTAIAPPDDLDAWIAGKQAQSRAEGAWDTAVERLVRNRAGRAELALLYVHGFGATRGEGELVVDTLARERGANAWYLRLPGHGSTPEAHATAAPAAYLREVGEALAAATLLGEKVVVIGTSTGGLLAAWAAATWPERVHALVLASPLFDYGAAWVGPVASRRLGVPLVERLLGPTRDAGFRVDPEGRKGPHYDRHWLTTQRYAAIGQLEDLRRMALRDDPAPRIRAPTLMLLHQGPNGGDTVISIPAARAAFDQIGGGRPPAGSARVEVADGAHVLLSEHVRTDKDAIFAALRAFLDAAIGPSPRQRAAEAAAGGRPAAEGAAPAGGPGPPVEPHPGAR